MRPRAAWVLATGVLLAASLAAVAKAGQAESPDVLADEPEEGETATYVGFERVTQNGFVVENRSLNHTRTWTMEATPLPDGSVKELATLSSTFPRPNASAPANESGTPAPLSTARNLVASLTTDGNVTSNRILQLDRHYTGLPGEPMGFSVALLDERRQESFWRVFRLHGFAEDWCASAPLSTLLDRGPKEARRHARGCLREVDGQRADDVTVTTGFQEHPSWDTVGVLQAHVAFTTSRGHPASLDVRLVTKPTASLELSRTVTKTVEEPNRTLRTVRHVEMTGYEAGALVLPDPGPLGAWPTVEEVLWTREGPRSDFQPGLSFSEARTAVHRTPGWQTYHRDHPDANLRMAYHLQRHEDSRSTPSTSSANLAHCRNPLVPRTPPGTGPGQSSWMLYWSGEGEDLWATVDEPRTPSGPGPADPPEKAQALPVDSKARQPGLSLPRLGPSPEQLHDRIDLLDQLGARGDAYAAILDGRLSNADSSVGEEALLGMAGRMRCTYNPATSAYGYEDKGLVFHRGEAIGVYTLQVEAVDAERRVLVGSLPPAPGTQQGQAAQPEGMEFTGAALAAGIAVTAGGRWIGSLYSRLQGRELLDDPVRRALHERIHDEPGVGLVQLADAIDRHRSTLAYHLERLDEEGFIETRTTSSGLLAFPPDSPLAEHADVLARGRARDLVEAVQRDPGQHLSAYADTLDVSKGYVSRIAGDLREAGLLDASREGRRLLLEPGPLAPLLGIPK